MTPLDSTEAVPQHPPGSTGRVRLSDQTGGSQPAEVNTAEAEPTTVTPPKLFPADETDNSHRLTSVPAAAIPPATASPATGAPTAVPPATGAPMQLVPAAVSSKPQPTAASNDNSPRAEFVPAKAIAVDAQAPAVPGDAAAQGMPRIFELQSEAGSSKAGSNAGSNP
jgi:hypothetical protein